MAFLNTEIRTIKSKFGVRKEKNQPLTDINPNWGRIYSKKNVLEYMYLNLQKFLIPQNSSAELKIINGMLRECQN